MPVALARIADSRCVPGLQYDQVVPGSVAIGRVQRELNEVATGFHLP
jgi:hypothetical protein